MPQEPDVKEQRKIKIRELREKLSQLDMICDNTINGDSESVYQIVLVNFENLLNELKLIVPEEE